MASKCITTTNGSANAAISFNGRCINLKIPLKSADEVIRREKKFGAHNYDPIPVALTRGKGIFF